MTTELILPVNYDEIAPIIESKGVLFDVGILREGRVVYATFYEPTRLQQDVASDLEYAESCSFNRVVVVRAVNEENMRVAASRLPPSFFEPV